MHRKLKKPQYGTKNLSKGAKSRVWVLADIQNFALCAHCVHGIPMDLTDLLPPPPPLPTDNFVLKNKVRTGVFVGHTFRCVQQYCESAVTHP